MTIHFQNFVKSSLFTRMKKKYPDLRPKYVERTVRVFLYCKPYGISRPCQNASLLGVVAAFSIFDLYANFTDQDQNHSQESYTKTRDLEHDSP